MTFYARPVVPSDTDLPADLLAGFDYHEGKPFDSREQAEAWGRDVESRFAEVSYVEIDTPTG